MDKLNIHKLVFGNSAKNLTLQQAHRCCI